MGCGCESVCMSLRDRVCVSQFSMLSSCRMDLIEIFCVRHVDICECIDICLGWRTCAGVLVGVGATARNHVCSKLCLYVCARSPGPLVPHRHTCLKGMGIRTYG